jgi:hypothetical protein
MRSFAFGTGPSHALHQARLSKQSGALITMDGSRQEIADIPRFAAPPGDAHRARGSRYWLLFSGLAAAPVGSSPSIGARESVRRLQFQSLRHLGAEADLKSLPSIHIRCRMPASLRATATIAHNMLDCLATRRPQARNADHFLTRSSRLAAAPQSASRALTSPCLVMRPSKSIEVPD